MRILYFNPETEYALASGASFYTPPAIVEQFRRANQLLPQAYARPDDVILVDDPGELKSVFRLIGWSDLAHFSSDVSDSSEVKVFPWGWNHALRRRLADSGLDERFLPSLESVDYIRCHSHRRSTIALNREWNALAPKQLSVPLPVELISCDECLDFWHQNPGCWLKAPWSSSGRGVINTAADMEERHIRPWCNGILRRQGSVMGESGAAKVADFASEWLMQGGVARYLGISSFETSRRGKYIRNHVLPQTELERRFDVSASIPFREVIDIQKTVLTQVFCEYDGPLGVDIIVCADGSLRPFTEVNMRLTMGIVNLESARSLL